MTVSPEQLQHAVKTIEAELTVLKQALAQAGFDLGQEGIIGTFDGEYLITDTGKRYQVPPNYASKSMLVPGDTLRMMEDPAGGQAKFKQIVKADRQKVTGLLARKDGKFEVLTDDGSFKVLAAAIKHYDGQAGDTVVIQYAKNHAKGSWAAVEKVMKPGQAAPQAASELPAAAPQPIVHSTVVMPAPVEAAPLSPTPSVEQPPVSPAELPAPMASPEAPAPQTATAVKPAASASGSSSRSNNRSDRSKPKSGSRNKPRAGSDDRRSSSRDAATSRPAQPRPQPAPAPAQPLTPTTGEISVASVMDDDDLV